MEGLLSEQATEMLVTQFTKFLDDNGMKIVSKEMCVEQPQRYLLKGEACKHLRISPKTFTNQVEPFVSFVKYGSKKVWDVRDLDDFVAKHKI